MLYDPRRFTYTEKKRLLKQQRLQKQRRRERNGVIFAFVLGALVLWLLY